METSGVTERPALREREFSEQDCEAFAASGIKDISFIENSCIHCNRLIRKDEVKILPPSYVLERDPYIRGGVVKSRFMCINCYNILRASARRKVRYRRPGTSHRLVREFIAKFMSA